MTEAAYPRWESNRKHVPLPHVMNGSPKFHNGTVIGHVEIKPYGGLTYEEWIESPMPESEFQDTRPQGRAENIGTQIQKLCRERDISASAAADIVYGAEV